MPKTNIPMPIRLACAEWGKAISPTKTPPTMRFAIEGKPDINLIDLLLETIHCLHGYQMSEQLEGSLRSIESWIISQAHDWTIATERGDRFDRSKGMESDSEEGTP